MMQHIGGFELSEHHWKLFPSINTLQWHWPVNQFESMLQVCVNLLLEDNSLKLRKLRMEDNGNNYTGGGAACPDRKNETWMIYKWHRT